MYTKFYVIEWTGVDPWGNHYSDRKHFDAEECEQMHQFVFELNHREGIRTITKNTTEIYRFEG